MKKSRAVLTLAAAGLLSMISLNLVGCTEGGPRRQDISSLSGTVEKISLLMAQRARDEDPGLYLYRIPYSRPLVESFYLQATGNERISRAILAAADAYDIPLPLAFALAWGESSFKVHAVNRNSGSIDRGLFQLNSRTFANLSEEQVYSPEINSRHGLAHLRFCLEEGKTEIVALAMYNAGTTRVRRGTPYSTLNHVAKIVEYREELERSFEAMLGDPGRIAAAMRPAGDS
ncbi:MAG: transglycosylase SLT domain-containing protein [Spirochaetales bacterium]|nr:transglycosylase SLT domain-containing protein [Spirochaetales bacterium]